MVLRVREAKYSIEKVEEGLRPFVLGYYNEAKHYETYAKWWTDRKQVAPRADVLSPIGLVVLENHEPIAMTFAFVAAETTLGNIGFTATKPTLGPRQRIMAVMFVLHEADKILREAGCRVIHTYSSESGLTKLFQRMGYVAQQPHTFLLKQIGGNKNGT